MWLSRETGGAIDEKQVQSKGSLSVSAVLVIRVMSLSRESDLGVNFQWNSAHFFPLYLRALKESFAPGNLLRVFCSLPQFPSCSSEV